MEYTFTETGKKAFEVAERELIEKLRTAVLEEASKRGKPIEITQSDVENVKINVASPSRKRITESILVIYLVVGILIFVGGLFFPLISRIWYSGDYVIRVSYLIALTGLVFAVISGGVFLFRRYLRK